MTVVDDLHRYALVVRSLTEPRWRATELARRGRHRYVDVAHLAGALLELAEVRRAVSVLGLDLDEVLAVVSGTQDELEGRGIWEWLVGPSETDRLLGVYGRAAESAMGAGLSHISPIALFVAIVGAEPGSVLGDRLDAMGLEALRLKLYESHGVVTDAPLPSGEGPCRVVFANDPYTTFEFVQGVLERYFELTSEDAAAFAVAVHRRGSAELPAADWERARRAAGEARSSARSVGLPLSISIRP